MEPRFELFPEQASTLAPRVDALFYYLTGVTVFFTLLIFILVVVFAVKYRRRPGDTTAPPPIHGSKALEIIWTVIPLVLVAIMFFWGAKVYHDQLRPPSDAYEVLVTGKQWMWKFQHPNGKREINDLHVPAGRPVKLTMGSEDVIHNVYVPAFRMKQDVVPGRWTRTWFNAVKPGVYRLFCNQYCGTNHSKMIGRVIVMEPREFQAWLGDETGATPAQSGEALFAKLACNTCHTGTSGARGPSLVGLFGKKVRLLGGKEVLADENYIRESITNPSAKIVEGYQPIMPSFQGLVTEEQLMQLTAYVKSLAQDSPQSVSPSDLSTTNAVSKEVATK
ncbi:MAG: cytochrome c oxidase subunit 2 [Candidatus Sumerlaea sp.]|uniref:Cytochrome c oxidase subunit 2 n=1 Tax=Sumerlaea chitinivorans TaxID=2250252 RepID=A0A2Z4Y339_SUMC1|nr:Cytochrome c oxidase polypeptide II [Candidatus Sumerlaea chitinivorans]GIX45300.1 MAG: cytochrome c oxidase subunit 2 [Candidatus Sumerlaea sp.]